MQLQKRARPLHLSNDVVFFSSGNDCFTAEQWTLKFISILKHFNHIYAKHVITVIFHLKNTQFGDEIK